MRKVFTILLLFFPFGVSAGQSNQGGGGDQTSDSILLAPPEIQRLMKSRDCKQADNFYNRTVYTGPFDYSWRIRPDEQIYLAFVCEKLDKRDEDPFKIVVLMLDGEKPVTNGGWNFIELEDCPSEIDFSYLPGGLQFETLELPSILKFYPWEQSRKDRWIEVELAPAYQGKSVIALDESSSGAGSKFFCMEGVWYNMPYD